MNLPESVETCIAHVLSTPTLTSFVLTVFLSFVLMYRFNVQRHLRYKTFHSFVYRDRTKANTKYYHRFLDKLLNCETCFAFWLCFLISTNLTTAAAAFLLFNYYEQKH